MKELDAVVIEAGSGDVVAKGYEGFVLSKAPEGGAEKR